MVVNHEGFKQVLTIEVEGTGAYCTDNVITITRGESCHVTALDPVVRTVTLGGESAFISLAGIPFVTESQGRPHGLAVSCRRFASRPEHPHRYRVEEHGRPSVHAYAAQHRTCTTQRSGRNLRGGW